MRQTLHVNRSSTCAVSCGAARWRSSRLVVRAQAQEHQHPAARAVPLQGNTGSEAFWLLDPLQDRYFNVHGPSFVIQRPETFAHVFPKLRLRKLHQREMHLTVKPSHAGSNSTTSTALVKCDAAQQLPVTLYGQQPVIDVTQILEQVQAEQSSSTAPACSVVASSNVRPGLVHVPMEGEQTEDGQEVYIGSSSSPRRTKMIGFTCLRCKARSYKPINPLSFEEGTLVVQCGKCECWHKIRDHLHLFHDMAGELFFRPSPITEADIPEALRMPLEPFYWMGDADASAN